MSQASTTLASLRRCQAARAAGHAVQFTTDPAWLVEQAINRRAGWPDAPGHLRGSARPVEGTYPKKASGDAWRHLRLIADQINTRRLIIRPASLGEWRAALMQRLPPRFTTEEN